MKFLKLQSLLLTLLPLAHGLKLVPPKAAVAGVAMNVRWESDHHTPDADEQYWIIAAAWPAGLNGNSDDKVKAKAQDIVDVYLKERSSLPSYHLTPQMGWYTESPSAHAYGRFSLMPTHTGDTILIAFDGGQGFPVVTWARIDVQASTASTKPAPVGYDFQLNTPDKLTLEPVNVTYSISPLGAWGFYTITMLPWPSQWGTESGDGLKDRAQVYLDGFINSTTHEWNAVAVFPENNKLSETVQLQSTSAGELLLLAYQNLAITLDKDPLTHPVMAWKKIVIQYDPVVSSGNASSSSGSVTKKAGFIAGMSVGLGILLIISVIAAVIYRRRAKERNRRKVEEFKQHKLDKDVEKADKY